MTRHMMALLVLCLHACIAQMNMENNEPISYDQWHFPYLTDMVNIQDDFFDWIENKVHQ